MSASGLVQPVSAYLQIHGAEIWGRVADAAARTNTANRARESRQLSQQKLGKKKARGPTVRGGSDLAGQGPRDDERAG